MGDFIAMYILVAKSTHKHGLHCSSGQSYNTYLLKSCVVIIMHSQVALT